MAQFIDPTNTELAKFETWRAHTGRQLAREIAGVRGCAPAIHFHDTANDTNTSLSADDDRIFTVYTGDRVHVWGQEMWVNNDIGDAVSTAWDSLNIYYRAHGSTSETDWLLVKGTAQYGKQVSTGMESHPNANLSSFNSALPYYNGGDGTGTAYYAKNNDPNRFSYLFEEIILGYQEGYFYGAGGGSSYSRMSGKSSIYQQVSMTNLRCFNFTKEGQYKLEIDETWSWKGGGPAGKQMTARTASNNYYADASTVANGQTDKWKRNNLFEPVDYTSNTGLYGTLPEQLKSNTGLSQTYRSNFTRKIIVNTYNHSKDLVTKGDITTTKPANITVTANTITTGTVITKPYQKVIGYGAVFQHVTNGYFIGGTDGQYNAGTTTATERFGKINQIWNGAGQRLINRRHL